MADLNRAMPVSAPAVLLPGGVPIGSTEFGIVLFPEETYTFNWKIPIKRDELEKACADMKPDKHFWPELLGLVTYSYPLATARADTGFVCCVERALPNGPHGRVLRLDEPVSGENLRISDDSLWSGFAT